MDSMDRFEVTTNVKAVESASEERVFEIFEKDTSESVTLYLDGIRYYASEVKSDYEEKTVSFKLDEAPPRKSGSVIVEGESLDWEVYPTEEHTTFKGNWLQLNRVMIDIYEPPNTGT